MPSILAFSATAILTFAAMAVFNKCIGFPALHRWEVTAGGIALGVVVCCLIF